MRLIDAASAIVVSEAREPLKLLSQRHGRAAWTFSATFGGGLLPGDAIDLAADVGPQARWFLGTQSSAKIFRSDDGREASQRLRLRVADDALAVFAPDPVVCFAKARYRQSQDIDLAQSGSLVLIDWQGCGRSSRGEQWSFTSMRSRTNITIDGRLVFSDALALLADQASALIERLAGCEAIATVVILGPALVPITTVIRQCFAESAIGLSLPLLASVSSLRDGLVMRIAGADVQTVGVFIRSQLVGLAPLLDGDPWSRKY